MKNLYLYFSGTGNTKYAVERFAEIYDKGEYDCYSIENEIDFHYLISNARVVTVGFPIYGSMIPPILADFLLEHKQAFKDKELITITTQLRFSGDGGRLVYSILKGVNVQQLHSIHLNMPSNISDLRLFKRKTVEECIPVITKADQKIEGIVSKINNGKTYKMGRRWYSWMLGFFIQRAYAKPMYKKMQKMLKINHESCIMCNKCVEECPTGNLFAEDGMIKTKDICTLCYRCVNLCPAQSISLYSKKKPDKQYIRKTYR